MIEISEDDLYTAFFHLGEQFLKESGGLISMDFDDATVKLKRHLMSNDGDPELVALLNSITPLLRDQKIEELAMVINKVKETRS